jgi:hypothetical protein
MRSSKNSPFHIRTRALNRAGRKARNPRGNKSPGHIDANRVCDFSDVRRNEAFGHFRNAFANCQENHQAQKDQCVF